jgi:hypothetical protein
MTIMSREEIASLIEASVSKAMRQSFRDVGIHTHDPDELEAIRSDLRFMRDLRLGVRGAATRVGTLVLLALGGSMATALGLGFKLMLEK